MGIAGFQRDPIQSLSNPYDVAFLVVIVGTAPSGIEEEEEEKELAIDCASSGCCWVEIVAMR